MSFISRLELINNIQMNNVNESGFDIVFELYAEINPNMYPLLLPKQTFSINVTISCLDMVISETMINGYIGTLEDFIKGYLEDGSNIQRARDNIARISKRIGLIE